MSKIPASARLREEIAAFLEQAETSESGAHALSRLVELAAARLVQEALEQEQTDFIGRERYVRQAGRGKRNGYVPGQLDTPRAGCGSRCARCERRRRRTARRSTISCGATRRVVEWPAIAMYARGLSTHDVEAAFTDERGTCLLSKSAVSELTDALWTEYEAFQRGRGGRRAPASA